jgi:hypothetical protein
VDVSEHGAKEYIWTQKKGNKKQEDGENCKMRSITICTFHQIVLG